MKILFLSFSDKDNDGRTKELVRISKMLGDTVFVGVSNKKNLYEKNVFTVCNLEISKIHLYLKFLFLTFKVVKKIGNIDCVFVDNYHAAFPGMLMKMMFPSVRVIQDCRELYFLDNLPTLFGKLLLLCEKRLLKQATVVLCANEIRSGIVKGFYKLKFMPITFENRRHLPLRWELSKMESENKEIIKVVSTDGLMSERALNRFLLAQKHLDKRFHFYLIGEYSESEFNKVNKFIADNGLFNIHIVNRMNQNELAEFISDCDIGIVKYNFDDLNNIFCASGKVYEFLMAGLPVVTTEHTVFKDICFKYNVGVCDNSFFSGIKKVAGNIDYYRANVKEYQRDFNSLEHINSVVKKIEEKVILSHNREEFDVFP